MNSLHKSLTALLEKLEENGVLQKEKVNTVALKTEELAKHIRDRFAKEHADLEIRRLLEDKFCIRAIFSLGGKSNVKKLYREFGNNTGGVKNYYIVDGDFDRYIDSESMIQTVVSYI